MSYKFAKPLGSVCRIICKPILSQRGETFADLFLSWEHVVGTYYSQFTAPERLIKDKASNTYTLVIKVKYGLGLELIHSKMLILERIGDFCGSRFIQNLKFVQGNIATLNTEKTTQPTSNPNANLEETLFSFKKAIEEKKQH